MCALPVCLAWHALRRSKSLSEVRAVEQVACKLDTQLLQLDGTYTILHFHQRMMSSAASGMAKQIL